jgi:hypothetical protein
MCYNKYTKYSVYLEIISEQVRVITFLMIPCLNQFSIKKLAVSLLGNSAKVEILWIIRHQMTVLFSN